MGRPFSLYRRLQSPCDYNFLFVKIFIILTDRLKSPVRYSQPKSPLEVSSLFGKQLPVGSSVGSYRFKSES